VQAVLKEIKEKTSDAEKEQQRLKRENAEIKKKQQYVDTIEELRSTLADLVSAKHSKTHQPDDSGVVVNVFDMLYCHDVELTAEGLDLTG